ncbi:hypothetical protein [Azospirillum palustre]
MRAQQHAAADGERPPEQRWKSGREDGWAASVRLGSDHRSGK